MFVKTTLQHFSELFFPRVCVVCGNKLVSQEEFICLNCQLHLPRTNFHNQTDNPMEQLFYGRGRVERATAFFEFQKGSDYQKILHHLKYRGMDKLGEYIGKLFASNLQGSKFVNDLNLILPVPLHPKKERKRGYNQSYHLSLGLSNSLGIPIDNSSLKRIVNTKTQTRKNRYERWRNVEGIFELVNPSELEDKHILLVDDVVTTGATLEACISAIHKKCDAKISLLTLAIA
ncbi:ComF family protein [Sunxiuqinia sp. A32]|uniref:ComF family protein n=1 Tax=Sunxiuqinia sp. A32 TaxID=3461496 RepID=UPI00404674AA